MARLEPRPYTIEEYTKTVCPECIERGVRADDPKAFVDGMLVAHDGKIWMRRFCGEHGESESLYEEDAALWRARAGWQTPTLAVTPDRADNFAGFPLGYREGLPAGHGQHSCILLLNITENCNFSCPTCFASALDPGTAVVDKPTLKELLHTVDTVIEREGGRLSVVMLSGGEPTLRRDLETLIGELASRPITRIMLNTNGRRIAKDPGFLRFLHENRKKVEIYLQFDGLRDSTYEVLRAQPIAAEKRQILQMLNDAEVFTTLVMTVKGGLNDDEVKDVFDLGLATPFCCGIAFQPVFGSGRNSGIDPIHRVTPTGVMKRLGREADFIPLPCSHRDCCDIAYFLRNGKGEWNSLVQLVGRDRMKDWIHLAANTISFEDARASVQAMIKDGTLQRILSEQQQVSSIQLAMDMVRMCDCVPGVRELFSSWWPGKKDVDLEKLATNTFRVTVKMFMDSHTFHEARIRQCCVHIGTYEEDPCRYSFCWKWLFEDASEFPERESTLRVL
jgi:7,8-dihydro-6-hydroxymethylpterin dimethyltransferase